MPLIPYKERKEDKSLWLYEFAYDMQQKKNKDNLSDYIKQKYPKEKFNTIDEKLADIKERIGFNLTTEMIGELEKTSSTINNCACSIKKDSCQCNVKNASKKDDITIMTNILSYIKQMVKSEPHLSSFIVLSRCKEEPDLRYSEIEHKIDKQKLSDYINKLINPSNLKKVDYISLDNDRSERTDYIADYYNHSIPTY